MKAKWERKYKVSTKLEPALTSKGKLETEILLWHLIGLEEPVITQYKGVSN